MTDRKTVLLVEDDPLLREAFRLLLEEAGYRVLEAGTANAALTLAREERPSVVLLDVGLPDRSGLEVARELTADAQMSGMPIVALTGHAGVAEERACREAGCTTYFAKPVEPKLLLNRLPELLQ